MPFYFRKSINAGPFRFNFSKSGIGVSVGVKGFRIGTGPRGHFVHAGAGGVYYRATVGSAGGNRRSRASPASSPPQPSPFHSDEVEMVEVESGEVLEMRDERFSDFLDEANAKQHQTRLAHVLPVAGLVIAFVPAFAFGPEFLLLLLVGAGGGYVLGRWLDSYRRVSVLFFEMDQHAAARYEALTRAFDQMAKCAGKWHIAAGGQVQDLATWKRNAGATTLLSRSVTTLHYALPEVINSNVTPPAIGVGRQTIYLMPDLLLVLDGVRFGAVAYEALGLEWQISNFIEEEAVPGDTQVLRYTWRHPNRSGGPDRRFANNYQIPVCEYEVLHLASENGLNELLQFSRAGVSAPFAEAVHQLDYASQQYVGTALLTGE